jgi:signal transduction histidine kinase
MKLTALLRVIIAIVLIVSSTTLYLYFKNSVEERLELQLLNAADDVLVDIAKDPDSFVAHPSRFIFPSKNNEFSSAGILVEFINSDGKIVSRSPSLKYNVLPFTKNDDNIMKDLEMEDGTKLKAFQRQIEVEDKNLGSLVMAISTSQMYHFLERLRLILLIALIITIAVFELGIFALVNLDMINKQKRFLGFVSHELRTPISAISGTAEVALREKTLSGEARETLTAVKDEADKMGNMVEKFLQIFRQSSGTHKLNKKEVDLAEILTESASRIKKTYPDKVIVLKYSDQAQITGDPDQLKNLFKNLIENAARNTKEGGRIEISLASSASELIITVKDNGAGIQKDQQKKIFDAFYQVEEGKYGGSGLGLAIAKWAVEAHKGRIKVISEPGKGSEFTVTLPRRS